MLSRLPLPLDALLSSASVAAGLALFCAFSFKGMRAYEETARHMRYSEDPVLRALFLAHKVSRMMKPAPSCRGIAIEDRKARA